MAWWWHWGCAHFGKVGGLCTSASGSSSVHSLSDHPRCYMAGATSQRPLLPQIWKHMKRAMTHRLQLSQLLDTSTDRLSSHVCITLQAAWRGKGSLAFKYSASRGPLTHWETLWRGWDTDAVPLLESTEERAEVVGGYLQTLRGMAFAVFLNLSLQTVKRIPALLPWSHTLNFAHFC